jgi:hypothetical protein
MAIRTAMVIATSLFLRLSLMMFPLYCITRHIRHDCSGDRTADGA